MPDAHTCTTARTAVTPFTTSVLTLIYQYQVPGMTKQQQLLSQRFVPVFGSKFVLRAACQVPGISEKSPGPC